MPRSEEGGAGRKAAGRLRRLLLVVPYLVRHPGSTIDELTNLFSVSRRDLLQDLNLLFVSGLPPYGPGDLIEVDIDDDGRVWVDMADYFARPLRLTRSEALDLYLRGKELLGAPGLSEAAALESALAKLERGLGHETLGELASQRMGGTLKGRIVLTAGLGGMGGAQPLAVTMNEGVALCVDIDPARIERRIKTRYCDRMTASLEEALHWVQEAKTNRLALSVGLVGNCAQVLPELLRRGVVPDLVTDQTSAHDPLNGYVPAGLTLEDAARLRQKSPSEYVDRALDSIAAHVKAMVAFQKAGSVVFDYGNNIRAMASQRGVQEAFAFPGFVPAYIRPLFCEGRGPFRWVALSGDRADIAATDEAALNLFPENQSLQRWLRLARERVEFQGLPARICWLGCGERAAMGRRLNELVRKGTVKAPVVIGRDHLDAGSAASPYRETEGMRDGSDAIADWPILNALLNTASGASWVSFHHGGGVGIGYSLHAGQAIVADGTREAATRLDRVLTNDPAIGILRHADAGYPEAIQAARRHGLKVPLEPKS